MLIFLYEKGDFGDVASKEDEEEAGGDSTDQELDDDDEGDDDFDDESAASACVCWMLIAEWLVDMKKCRSSDSQFKS